MKSSVIIVNISGKDLNEHIFKSSFIWQPDRRIGWRIQKAMAPLHTCFITFICSDRSPRLTTDTRALRIASIDPSQPYTLHLCKWPLTLSSNGFSREQVLIEQFPPSNIPKHRQNPTRCYPVCCLLLLNLPRSMVY